MKLLKIFSTMLLSILFFNESKAQDDFVKGEIYLKLKDNQPVTANNSSSEANIQRDVSFLSSFIQQFHIQQTRRPFWKADDERLNRIFRIKISEDSKVALLIEILKQRKEVEYAERVPLDKLNFTPGDLGENNSSDKGQYSLYKVHAMEAWDLCQGEPDDFVLPIIDKSIVAIVDNGFDMNHPDLINQYIMEYDVSDDDGDASYPSTNFDHGTHCAGIVAATTNNGDGIASLGYNLKIMAIKAEPNSGTDTTISDGYDGILMAALLGARIISCSWGSSSISSANKDILDYVMDDLDCVVVAAAGNDNTLTKNYPSAYSGVVAVASTDINDVKASSSTYGSWISVCAPGVSIYSTIPNDDYDRKSGTSMATPLVAALCGLIRVIDPLLSQADVKDLIESTADDIDALNPAYAGLLGAGRINAYEALKAILPCTTTSTLTGEIGIAKKEASVSIAASGTVTADQLTLDAGSYVDLKEGFVAADGHQLIVINDGCGGAKFSPGQGGDSESNELSDENIGTSVSDLQKHTGFQVFPNPASALVTIRCDIAVSGLLSIYLADLAGKRVRTVTDLESIGIGIFEKQLDCSNLPNGLYHCVIISNNAVQTIKISVLH